MEKTRNIKLKQKLNKKCKQLVDCFGEINYLYFLGKMVQKLTSMSVLVSLNHISQKPQDLFHENSSESQRWDLEGMQSLSFNSKSKPKPQYLKQAPSRDGKHTAWLRKLTSIAQAV